jgi:hypothetical protein
VNDPNTIAAGPAVSTNGVALLKAANVNSTTGAVASEVIETLPVEV